MSEFEYIFVADLFVEDYLGGAELTLEALIQAAPGPVAKVHGSRLTKEFIQEHKDKTWIFGNYASVPKSLLIDVALDLNYFIVECDYKYCKYRSAHLHQIKENSPCNCNEKEQGRFTLGFFARSKGVFFMSEAQKAEYQRLFPKLETSFDDLGVAEVQMIGDVDSLAEIDQDFQTLGVFHIQVQSYRRLLAIDRLAE